LSNVFANVDISFGGEPGSTEQFVAKRANFGFAPAARGGR
jgi:hypothetical protein